jgi:hypothetical protein
MTQQIPGDLTPQFAEAVALAAQYDQPGYVLVAEGEHLALGVLWSEVLPGDWRRIVAIILPNGTIFERASASVE